MKFNRVIFFLAMIAAITGYPAGPQAMSFTEDNFFAGPVPYAMYVESFIPAKPTHKTPIVLIHGCCTTGAGFISTPDGREGWAKYFVRNGWITYVVDMPGHGRSPMPEDYATMSLQHAVDDTVVLLKKIGPSVVLVHSIGGMVGWKLCETVPDQVAAIIGVAPVPPANMPKDSFPAASAIGQSFKSSGTGGAGPYLPEDKPAWYKPEAAKGAFASASLFPVEAMDQYYASLVPESARRRPRGRARDSRPRGPSAAALGPGRPGHPTGRERPVREPAAALLHSDELSAPQQTCGLGKGKGAAIGRAHRGPAISSARSPRAASGPWRGGASARCGPAWCSSASGTRARDCGGSCSVGTCASRPLPPRGTRKARHLSTAGAGCQGMRDSRIASDSASSGTGGRAPHHWTFAR